MRIRTLFPSSLGLLVLASTAFAQTPVDAEQRVREFIAASDRQDVDAMIAATDPQFRWMSIDGERIAVEVVGQDQLRSWLEGYFKTTRGVRTELGPIAVDGPYATAVEQVSWDGGEGRRAQSALSVYQFNADGKIRSVWYFPSFDRTPKGTAP